MSKFIFVPEAYRGQSPPEGEHGTQQSEWPQEDVKVRVGEDCLSRGKA